MKIVVGLGNPGEKYQNSRHNAGFMFLDKLSGDEKFGYNKKFEAEVMEKNGLVFVKPQTFMNESGRSVRKVMDFYKLETADLVLVHDDLDIVLGEFKIQEAVGPKVHNGVNSVESYLSTTEFLRVRLGVDNRKVRQTSLGGADYVLEDFGKEERIMIEDVIEKAIPELLIALGL